MTFMHYNCRWKTWTGLHNTDNCEDRTLNKFYDYDLTPITWQRNTPRDFTVTHPEEFALAVTAFWNLATFLHMQVNQLSSCKTTTLNTLRERSQTFSTSYKKIWKSKRKNLKILQKAARFYWFFPKQKVAKSVNET